MPSADSESAWAQLTQVLLNVKHQAPFVLCSELMVVEMLVMEVLVDQPSKERMQCSSQRHLHQQLLSIIILAALLSHILFKKAVPVKSLI